MKRISLFLLFIAFSANAKYDTCLFGNHSYDHEDRLSHFEEVPGGKDLQPGVEFTENEKALILKAVNTYDNEVTFWKQIEEDYFDSYTEWGISYFKDTMTDKTYVYFNGYPGDNEVGSFLDPKTNEVLVEIGDGDLYNCKAQFSSYEKLPFPIPRFNGSNDGYGKFSRCHFGGDLLELSRNKLFSFEKMQDNSTQYGQKFSVNFKNVYDNSEYTLTMYPASKYSKTHRAVVTTANAPKFEMARYEDGEAVSCVKSDYYGASDY